MFLAHKPPDVPGPIANPFVVSFYPGVGSVFYRPVLTNQ
jgi:hypothetical protein